MKKVYLSGPIQHLEDNGVGWRQEIEAEYDSMFEWINPLKKYNRPTDVDQQELVDKELVEADIEMIDNSDAMFVNWLEVPTAGTPMEIFYAARECDIPIAVQFDTPPEASPWVRHHADFMAEDTGTALRYLR